MLEGSENMGKYYKAIVPKGTHLADSQKGYGKKRGALLDNKTNKVVGTFVGLAAVSKIEKAMRSEIQTGLSPSDKYRIQQEIEMRKEIERERLYYEEMRRQQEQIRKDEARQKSRENTLSFFKALGKGIWFIIKHLGLAIWFIIKYLGLGIGWLVVHLYKWTIEFIKWAYVKHHFAKQERIRKKNRLNAIKNSAGASSSSHCLYTSSHASDNHSTEIKQTNSYSNTSMNVLEYQGLVDQIYADCEKYTIDNDKQIHLINILILSVQLAYEIRALYSTNDPNLAASPDYIKWQRSMEKIASKTVIDKVNHILQTNNASIPQDKMEQIIQIFHAGMFEEGIYIPIKQTQVSKLLIQ